MEKYFKGNVLLDGEIVEALRRAADDYEDGAIIEVRDELVDIVNAIDKFIRRNPEA